MHSHAQTIHKCYTSEMEKENEQRYPEWEKQRHAFEQEIQHRIRTQRLSSKTTYNVITIPVVVHVLHNNIDGSISGENIPDQQIIDQIKVLNEDYRRTNIDASNTPLIYQNIASDIEIQFCLANRDPLGNMSNGINRVYNKATRFIYPDNDAFLKSLSYWPSDQYLNIWVCDLANKTQTQTILGYAQFPSSSSLVGLNTNEGDATTDGVVINYRVFGKNASTGGNYDLGRTTTHEVGHWLGLIHTWGDGDCSATDYCNDTPSCNGEIYTSSPACNSLIQCTNRRMIENYMDYSDDGCMNLFTADQKTRMRTALDVSPRRLAIQSSKGCCDTCEFIFDTDVLVYPIPSNQYVTIKTTFAIASSVQFYVYSVNGKLMLEDNTTPTQKYERMIDVRNWAQGVYIIKIITDKQAYERKVLIIE
jgi:hypothetical protein